MKCENCINYKPKQRKYQNYKEFILEKLADENNEDFVLLSIPVLGWCILPIVFGFVYPIWYYIKK